MLSFRNEKASLHKRVVTDPAPAFGNRFVGTPVYMVTSVAPHSIVRVIAEWRLRSCSYRAGMACAGEGGECGEE